MNDPRRAGDLSGAEGGWADPETTTTTGASRTSAWDSLTDSLGGLPRVLLRDTDADGESPSEPPSRPGSSEMPAPGTMPGRLQLLGEIARGGMGAILKGRDPDLCRDLAVKVLLERHRDDPGLSCRFVEEAQIAGQLQHPGVVPVYRLGTLPDDRPYFTMKLVKGRTLAALLGERNPVRYPNPPHADPAIDNVKNTGAAARPPRPNGERVPERRVRGRALEPGTQTEWLCSPAESVSPLESRLQAVPGPAKAGTPTPTPVGRGSPEPALDRTEGRSRTYSDLPRFLSIFEQICRTMAYAHSRRVIHRDLKPSNIMVGGFGEVQVMDWGLAKVLSGGEEAPPPNEPSPADETRIATARSGSAGSDLSSAGSVIGTPAYMAPEQARGEISRNDTRADVFALGAILCEILTGRPPYLGRVPGEVQRKAMRGDLSDALGAIASCGADPELLAIARDCLAGEPEDRPGDAGVVADRVSGYLAGVEVRLREAELQRASETARAQEALEAAAAERRARRLTVGLATAVLLLVGITGGGYAWLERERSARRASTARAVVADLDRARELEATALAAPPDQPGPWPEALAAAHGAEYRLKSGEAAEPLRQRVAQVVAAIEHGRRKADEKAAQVAADRNLLSELESIRGSRAEHLDPKRTDAEYAAAFRQAGLDLDATDSQLAGDWIAARSAPLELASFLDDWALIRRRVGGSEQAVGRLVTAARAADRDPWRDALRARFGGKGSEALAALRKLAGDEKALESQPIESMLLLARRLKEAGDGETAARVLRRAWQQRPDDFWVNFELAGALGPLGGSAQAMFPRPEEAVRHLTAALAIRTRSIMARNNLGIALISRGRLDESIAEFRAAIRLKPDDGIAHSNLGNALDGQGKLDEAIAEYRTAIRLEPDDGFAHSNLAKALRDQGKLDEAIAAYRTAIRLKPDFVEAHSDLGVTLASAGRSAESFTELLTAVRLQPGYGVGHYNLGLALQFQGRRDDAIAEYREAIRLRPDYAEAHCNLGLLLEQLGRYDESLRDLRQGHEMGSKQPRWPYPSAEWLRRVERTADLASRLPAVLENHDKPRDSAETIEFARICFARKRHAASARLYAKALEADPTLADDRRSPQRRYDAACSAALGGCGKGDDEPRPDEAARARLRRQALDWLKAELAAWGRILDVSNDSKAREGIAKTFQHWKVDTDLAGVRDTGALTKLPEAERAAWRALWNEVDAVLARAEGRRR
jgi:serine/threonine-protein kinase